MSNTAKKPEVSVPPRSAHVSGKTVRMSWTAGPTQGSAQDHRFHTDGTVEWHSAEPARAPAGAPKKDAPVERPPYAAVDVGKDLVLVSYLSKSGYTLTCALNLADGSIAGVASNHETWMPVAGRFEFLG